MAMQHAPHAACTTPAGAVTYSMFNVGLLNVGLTRTRVPTATPEDDRGEKAEPRRFCCTRRRKRFGALLNLSARDRTVRVE